MRTSFTQMYVHCVWATWNREPLITRAVQGMIYGAIVHQCEVLKCTVIAIGGVEDHVHLLVGFPPTLAVSELVKKVKGTSSHLVNSKNEGFFKWQGAYGAFTVSQRSLDQVADYIRNQEMHHHQKTSIPVYELMDL
jgi:putative transposase